MGEPGQDGFFEDKSRDDMQKLFLLEVLVDNLFIKTDSSSPNLSKDLAANMADTCVMFQFLHYPPLVVCESDFIGTAVSGKDTSQITFKSGKSCFFSLRTPKGPILPVPFDVKVSVIRKMKEGVLPDKLELGKTNIDLGENFTELLKQNTDESYCDFLPMSKIKKDTFDIKDDGGRKVGSLTAFLRLSCFGKLIITQFSLNKEDEKKYLFKGTDLKEVCKKDLGQIIPGKGEGFTPGKPSCPPKQQDCPATCRCGPYENGTPVGNDVGKPPKEPLSDWKQSQVEQFDPRKGPPPTRGAPPYNLANDIARPPGRPLSQWEQGQIETFDPRRGPPPTRGAPPYNLANDIARPPGRPLSQWEQGQIETFNARRGPPPRGAPPYNLANDIARPPGRPLSQWEQGQIETFDARRGPPPRGAPPFPYNMGNDIARPPGRPLSQWEQGQIETFDPRRGPPPTRGAPPYNLANDIARPPGRPLSQWEQGQIETFDPQRREYPPSKGTGGGRLCDCPYPVPPSVMAKYGQRSDKNMDLAPGEVGLQDDQVIFQLPLKKPGDPLSERDQQMDSQVYYKLTSAEETKDGMQKNTVNVKSDDIPGMATKTAVSPVSGLPVDDGHDVFLLKIGKKCEGDKKRNLELELRTPKMKEPKPPMSDRDTQYLESDVPKPSKKGSKDKGKGKGKGSKGGKGGKKGKK